jgi:hypothetical protein
VTDPYAKQPSGSQPPGRPPYPPPPQYAYGPYPPPYGPPGYGWPPQVDKHTGWFVVNWVFFWPLALYSLLSAYLNIDKALYAGDIAGAQHQAARVRKFGIIALCIGIAWMVVAIAAPVLFMVTGSTAVHCVGPYGTSC